MAQTVWLIIAALAAVHLLGFYNLRVMRCSQEGKLSLSGLFKDWTAMTYVNLFIWELTALLSIVVLIAYSLIVAAIRPIAEKKLAKIPKVIRCGCQMLETETERSEFDAGMKIMIGKYPDKDDKVYKCVSCGGIALAKRLPESCAKPKPNPARDEFHKSFWGRFV